MLRQENFASVLLRPRRTRVSSQVPSGPVVEPRSLHVIAPALNYRPRLRHSDEIAQLDIVRLPTSE